MTKSGKQKIFITGVSGYIGGAIARKMLAQGHQVMGLVRKREQFGPLENQGVIPLKGSLDDLAALQKGSRWADVVINAANYEDLSSTAIFLSELRQTGKSYVHVGGSSIAGVVTMGLADSTVYSEQTIQPRLEKTNLAAIHAACKQASANGIRSVVVAPSIVYNENMLQDSAFFSTWAQWAQELGTVPYLGDGQNIWSNVHLNDLTDLFILAIQLAPSGSVFFAENGSVSMKEMAIFMSDRLGLKCAPTSLPIEAFISKWGLATSCTVFGGNSRVSAKKAKDELGWNPNGPHLGDVLKNGFISLTTTKSLIKI